MEKEQKKHINKKIIIIVSAVLVLLCVILLLMLQNSRSCADGHQWGEWAVTREPTCSVEGTQIHICKVCHKTEAEAIPTLEHEYRAVWEAGETRHWHECTVCGSKCEAEWHTPGEWEEAEAPTCTAPGIKKRSCAVCDKEEVMTIPATGHTYSDVWSINSIKHFRVCTVCGARTEATAHAYENWTIVKEATYQSDGSKVSTCTECGYKCTEGIPRLGAQSIAIEGGKSVAVGGTLQLSAVVTPETLTDKSVIWSSSKKDVAVIDVNGTVTGLKTGSTKITATAANGKKISTIVWVTETAIDGNLDDELYTALAPFCWNQAEYNIGENIRLYLGSDGLYIADQVSDAEVKNNGDKSHIEAFLTLSDAFEGADSIGLRFYPNGYSATGSVYRTYVYDYKGTDESYHWSERKGTELLDMAASVKYTEDGYNVEVFIPWGTLGLTKAPSSVHYMSVATAVYGKEQKMRYGTYQDDVISYRQVHAYDTANYIEYDNKGFVHKEVCTDKESVVLGNNFLTDQKYTTEFRLNKMNDLNLLTGVSFTGTGAQYIKEVGNGVYKISIPYANRKELESPQVITIIDGRNIGKTFTLQVVDAWMIDDLAVTYDGKTVAPVLYGTTGTLDMTKFAVAAKETTALDCNWSMTCNGKKVMDLDMNASAYAFANAGTYVLTADIATQGYIGSADMTIYVLNPDVYVNYASGTVVNSGSDTTAVVGSYKLNAENNSTAFEAVANSSVSYTTGIGGDKKGAINTNHLKGAYTVVKDWAFGTNDFTISTWFQIPKGETVSKGSATYLFGIAEPDKTDSGFAVSLKSNRLRIKLLGSMYDPEISYEQGVWYNLTFCREGSAVRVYFDGRLLAVYTIDAVSNFGTADLSFGAYIGRVEKYQDSKMYFDDVQVYRAVLTAEQIQAISLADEFPFNTGAPSPKVQVNYTGGTVANSGTDSTIIAGAYVMDAFKNATRFETTNTVIYMTGRGGDTKGAISTNHYRGAYTVVKNYNFGKDDFSISAWFHVPADAEVSTGSSTYLFGIDHPDTSSKFAVCLKPTELRVRLAGTSKFIRISYKKGTWYNLTLCREGTAIKVYFDGTLVGTYGVSENCDFGTADLAFGGYYGVSYAYKDANTYFDDIQVYSEALTQEQIQEILVGNEEK